MVSPELLRRYPFFAGLSHDHILTLARLSDELMVDAEHSFFREEDDLEHFFLVLEGAIAIVMALPDRDVKHKISEQFLRDYKTKDVTVSTVGSGDVFGWSGLVAPYKATAGAKAIMPSRVLAFQSKELLKIFDEDREFGMLMTRKAAQIVRDRLRDLRIESLAFNLA